MKGNATVFTEITKCRICGNSELVPILSLGTQYMTGIFPSSLEQEITCGPLELVACAVRDPGKHCGLVQLKQTYQLSEMYSGNYGYRSGLNRSMVSHLQHIADGLMRIAPVRKGDLVLDIGSNDGTLLSFYPSGGPVLCGIDPTASKFREFYREDINVLPDFFSAELVRRRFGDQRASIVTSISMFYDLQLPMEFVRQIREVLADDGIWMLEQSYLPSMLRATAYDTICHEHLEYYAVRQLQFMMERSGMKLLDVTEDNTNGGSFAVTVARAESRRQPNARRIDAMLQRECDLGIQTLRPLQEFQRRILEHRENLQGLLEQLRRAGRVVLGYGASTKGNVLLQFCGINSQSLPAIAEVNSDKFGCFTPGTLIPIISEEQAMAMRPDAMLVLPWHFRETILQRESVYLRGGGKMIFPLPEIEIV